MNTDEGKGKTEKKMSKDGEKARKKKNGYKWSNHA
jgi:hypothetical protein